jgi:HK97 gp10 family phage protein
MAGSKVSLEGFSDLDKTLGEFTKATAKGVLRRVLLKAGQPMADTMKALAPDDPGTGGGDLKSSIAVSTKLSKRQAKSHRRKMKNEKAFAEAFVGPGPDPAAWNQEFGNVNHGPQAFARPAWDQKQRETLDIIKSELATEIEKTAKRQARRAARAR